MNKTITTARATIVIREAKPTDALHFRELRLAALRDNPIAFTADYQKNFNQPTRYWEDLLTMLADESTIFLAEHENTLIGMTGVVRGSAPKTRHVAWIWGVYISPEFRGLHLAEGLIRSCFDWAKARQVVLAKLGVAAVNQSAIRCYERCGFKTYGTEPRAILFEGRYYDEHLMFLDLDAK